MKKAYLNACQLDIQALKPGNVGEHGAGHGMDVTTFQRAARASVDALCDAKLSVGLRILQAVDCSWQKVGVNANLGIVMLAAPLIFAAQRLEQQSQTGRPTLINLREELKVCLYALTQEDARHVYMAIVRANPGGLAASRQFDVRDGAPSATLLEVMEYAKGWNAIAAEYATGFAKILDDGGSRGLSCFRRTLAKGWTRQWAASVVYLDFLAHVPDSHLIERHADVLPMIQDRAKQFLQKLNQVAHPEIMRPELLQWDEELKARGLNPGTSADLTVAVALADELVSHAASARHVIDHEASGHAASIEVSLQCRLAM